MTVVSRAGSAASFPEGLPVVRVPAAAYAAEHLVGALRGQDAVVCALGPQGIDRQAAAVVDAAEAAGVGRLVVDDFGWGPRDGGGFFPEFAAAHAERRAHWDRARARAEANPAFTWTGVSIGNPVDWVSSTARRAPGSAGSLADPSPVGPSRAR